MSLIAACYGAGTNSTALLAEMVRLGLPCDVITFSDTGGERPEIYTYVAMFSAWLVERGYPPIETVRSPNTTLEAMCLRLKALPSVAYGFKTCSQRFKVEPQEKYLNNHPGAKAAWAAGMTVTKLIGFDADEPHRARPFSDDKYTVRYPLIEWGMGRDACVEAIARAGLPQPGKSSCFFCPNSSDAEVVALQHSHPDLLQRALAMEANADLSTIKGLGRRWSWADVVRADAAQIGLFPSADMPCGCYDGRTSMTSKPDPVSKPACKQHGAEGSDVQNLNPKE